MQAAQANKSSPAAVMVCDLVRTIGVGDVHLNHDQLRCVVEREALHMFVHNRQRGHRRINMQRVLPVPAVETTNT